MKERMIMYIVIIHQGTYEDYERTPKFVTKSKDNAELWVTKFNKIMEDNKERFSNYVWPESYEKLWSDMFDNGVAEAAVEEIEYRWV